MKPTHVIRSQRQLHEVFRTRLYHLLEDIVDRGLPFRVFESLRTPMRQRYLYSKGRFGPLATKRIVTRAKPWQSMHQYGLAADIVLYEDGWTWRPGTEWMELRKLAQKNGLQTLSFEAPHVQYPYKIRSLKRGEYPGHGGEAWEDWMRSMIEAYPKGAPVPPRRIESPAERPYLGEVAVSWMPKESVI